MVPQKIRCGLCQKNKHYTKYSNKQINDLEMHMQTFNNTEKKIWCRVCTGGNIHEIQCYMCDEWKGLEEFAASQRSKQDTARCFKCTDDQVKQTPVNEDIYEDPHKAFITPDYSGGKAPEYFSSATSLTGTSSTHGDEWGAANGDTNGAQKGKENDMITMSYRFRRGLAISSSASETAVSQTGYAPARNFSSGDTGSRADARTQSWHTESSGPPSTNSRSFASSTAAHSAGSSLNPSGPPSGLVRPKGDSALEGEPIVNAWGSDDEEEENEDEDDSDYDDDTVI